ncbi:inactive sodium-dependent neutral amino acid transporter B(0)AT3 isoform X2 [Bos javanicus]|uniref:inactive sodium-dependent neutral amino acid transporter B(0)AT3 isoform X2 n=1 Tax=Bos javanicus TaxID=9906 RepID=UPI002AA8CEE4|nr:inactive sodium-dependent neutral amino acid transporter B(0)AT3 isoform X2 [Bos javanicus]
MARTPGPDQPVDGGGEERPAWDNKLQYLLSCVGFAVGLGNLWRFPYLCQTHGGGAFLIPYIIALAFEGIPLFHIELAVGQRLRRGSVGVWTAISPYLGGMGLGCFTVSFLVSLYYNTILTWVLWYLLNSFQHPLPWSACPLDLNRTGLVQECRDSSPVSYFWYRRTLNVSADIGDSGPVQWRLLVCLAVSWAVVYLCVIRGIETTGKLRVLQNPRVWLDAATQIFFSLSLALGGHIAFASYNPPRNNCGRDAVGIALVNSMTSLYASIAVFSVLGFKAASDHGRCLDRNILHLINAFDLPEQSVSRDTYTAALARLNASQPAQVAGLPLEACRLEDFLDKPGPVVHVREHGEHHHAAPGPGGHAQKGPQGGADRPGLPAVLLHGHLLHAAVGELLAGDLRPVRRGPEPDPPGLLRGGRGRLRLWDEAVLRRHSLDDREAARLLLAGNLEGREPPAAADHLPGLCCPPGQLATALQGLEPPIRAVPLAAGEALPGLGAGRLCAPVLPAHPVGPGGGAGPAARPVQTEDAGPAAGQMPKAPGRQGLLSTGPGWRGGLPVPQPGQHQYTHAWPRGPVVIVPDTVVPSGPAHGTARLACQSTLLSKWPKPIVRLLGPVAGGSAWGPRGGHALSPRAKRWW